MTENNTQGVHKHRSPIPMDNPEIKKGNDWWDDLCKAHGVVNHWKKKTNKPSKKSKKSK